MDAKEIYDLLLVGGLSRAGALGMIGNMAAESSLKPNIAQRGMTTLSDEQYTAAVDNGLLDFVHDSVGYGLCQWTYSTRKQGLLNKARAYGASVGDGALQVEYCLDELTNDYPDLYKRLCESNSIDECSDLICTQFERPAVNNLLARREFAHKYEAEIPVATPKPYTPKDPMQAAFPPDPTVLAFQLWMNYNGYNVEANGHKSAEFFNVLKQFVADMEVC